MKLVSQGGSLGLKALEGGGRHISSPGWDRISLGSVRAVSDTWCSSLAAINIAALGGKAAAVGFGKRGALGHSCGV